MTSRRRVEAGAGSARGLRELSCLDLRKIYFPRPPPSRLFATRARRRKPEKGESQTMINVILIEVNLWCKFRANGS